MTTISISDLKKNPTAALAMAVDFPIAVQNRSKTTGYVLSPQMFEKLVSFVEDCVDNKAADEADYKHGTKLNDFIKELELD